MIDELILSSSQKAGPQAIICGLTRYWVACQSVMHRYGIDEYHSFQTKVYIALIWLIEPYMIMTLNQLLAHTYELKPQFSSHSC